MLPRVPELSAPSSLCSEVKIEELFAAFDTDNVGRLGQDQYKTFLMSIGIWGDMWGTYGYTHDKWEARWPKECEKMGVTAEKGIDLKAFTLVYTKYR